MDNNFFNIQSYEKIFYYKPLPDDTLFGYKYSSHRILSALKS
jgi:hypothetical protein